MAEYALIDGYLDAFRTHVGWRRDVDDLVAEVQDHLYSTVERFEARGTDPKLAQRQTLERFGNPDLMAEAFASTPRGGIAVPTKFTTTAGTAAVAAAALWVAAAAYYAVSRLFDSDWLPVYLVFMVLVVAAGLMTMMTSVALRERHGGLGWLGFAGVILLGGGLAVSFIATWAVPLWMAAQGVGMAFIALAMWPLRVAPRAATVAYGTGHIIGTATFFVLTSLKVGSVDEWGDYPAAWILGLGVGLVITAAGLLGIGLWLRSEDPAPVDPLPDEALTA